MEVTQLHTHGNAYLRNALVIAALSVALVMIAGCGGSAQPTKSFAQTPQGTAPPNTSSGSSTPNPPAPPSPPAPTPTPTPAPTPSTPPPSGPYQANITA